MTQPVNAIHPIHLTQPSVWATLKAHDALTLIDYCVETFGFLLATSIVDGDTVHHAELRWPEGAGAIMIGSYDPDGPWAREPGTCGLYVVVADIDKVHDQVLARGAEVVRPLADTDYGSREFAVRDPEGNLWSFGTYLGEPLPSHS